MTTKHVRRIPSENMAEDCLGESVGEILRSSRCKKTEGLVGEVMIEAVSRDVINRAAGSLPSFWFKKPMYHLFRSSVYKAERDTSLKLSGIPKELFVTEGFFAFQDRSFIWFCIVPDEMRGAFDLAGEIEDFYSPDSKIAETARILANVGCFAMPMRRQKALVKASEIEGESPIQTFLPFGEGLPLGRYACASIIRKFLRNPFEKFSDRMMEDRRSGAIMDALWKAKCGE